MRIATFLFLLLMTTQAFALDMYSRQPGKTIHYRNNTASDIKYAFRRANTCNNCHDHNPKHKTSNKYPLRGKVLMQWIDDPDPKARYKQMSGNIRGWVVYDVVCKREGYNQDGNKNQYYKNKHKDDEYNREFNSRIKTIN